MALNICLEVSERFKVSRSAIDCKTFPSRTLFQSQRNANGEKKKGFLFLERNILVAEAPFVCEEALCVKFGTFFERREINVQRKITRCHFFGKTTTKSIQKDNFIQSFCTFLTWYLIRSTIFFLKSGPNFSLNLNNKTCPLDVLWR